MPTSGITATNPLGDELGAEYRELVLAVGNPTAEDEARLSELQIREDAGEPLTETERVELRTLAACLYRYDLATGRAAG